MSRTLFESSRARKLAQARRTRGEGVNPFRSRLVSSRASRSRQTESTSRVAFLRATGRASRDCRVDSSGDQLALAKVTSSREADGCLLRPIPSLLVGSRTSSSEQGFLCSSRDAKGCIGRWIGRWSGSPAGSSGWRPSLGQASVVGVGELRVGAGFRPWPAF
jgi:hypothetical protein